MDARWLPERGSIKSLGRGLLVLSQSTIFLAMVLASRASAEPPPSFTPCLACHAVGPGASNKNGPVLNGVAGKPAGAVNGFTYSEALQTARAAGLVWSDENLDRWLADPAGFLPGGRMAWLVPDATERQAIITYLKTLP